MNKSYTLSLTSAINCCVKTGLKLVRGDKGIELRLRVSELDTSNATAKIVFNRANASSVEADLDEPVNGEYVYTIQGNELAIVGVTRADVKFYEGEKRISTASFIFEVVPDTLDDIGGGAGGYSDQLESLTEELKTTLAYYEEAFGDSGALIAKGTWNSSTTYEPLNLVFYDGSSWVCRKENKNHRPASGEYWQLLISGGGGSSVVVDDSLSTTSENPVQNKVITEELNKKLEAAAISGKADKLVGGTTGNLASIDDDGNIADSGKKASDFLTEHQDISGKSDKVANATSGNFAGLDANGNLADSGKKAADFAPAEHTSASAVGSVGAHDIRYYNSNLQVKENGSWKTLETGGGGATITVDDALSTVSPNPVENRVVASALNQKANKISGGTAGNFVATYADGLQDSGYSENSFAPAAHVSNRVNTSTGQHGIRVYNGKVQFYDGNSWADLPSDSAVDKVKTSITVPVTAWSADSTYDGYGYKAEIAFSGIDATYFADVVLDPADAMSGKFAPVCNTDLNKVVIYASEVPSKAMTVLAIKAAKVVSA